MFRFVIGNVWLLTTQDCSMLMVSVYRLSVGFLIVQYSEYNIAEAVLLTAFRVTRLGAALTLSRPRTRTQFCCWLPAFWCSFSSPSFASAYPASCAWHGKSTTEGTHSTCCLLCPHVLTFTIAHTHTHTHYENLAHSFRHANPLGTRGVSRDRLQQLRGEKFRLVEKVVLVLCWPVPDSARLRACVSGCCSTATWDKEQEASCCICLSEYEDGDEVRHLPCGGSHHFHKE